MFLFQIIYTEYLIRKTAYHFSNNNTGHRYLVWLLLLKLTADSMNKIIIRNINDILIGSIIYLKDL